MAEKINLSFKDTPDFSSSGEAIIPDAWWTSFNDPTLNAHINTALNNNFSLAAAAQRLNAARAIAVRERSALFPDIDLGASASRTIDDSPASRFTFGPEASYEADLWGRIRAGIAAEDLRAKAQEQDYYTAALVLSADIAVTWMRLTEAYQQLALLNEQIEVNEKTLKVLRGRFGIGLVRSEDILRQQLLTESLLEERISVETDVQILEHQLAVLRGEPPQGSIYSPATALPALPPKPQTGLPIDLIQRRPDVQSAYFDIRAADKDLAAALRDRYPRLTLSASYISEAASAGNLFSNWITSIAGALIAPVFDGGERQAEITRSQARRAELLNTYKQTVLEAFQDVEDALTLEEQQLERIENLERRLSIARKTYKQIQTGYFNGVNDYLDTLNTLTDLQRTERDILSARRILIEYRITLYRALSGSFDPVNAPYQQELNRE